jgi:hypothetical protein
VLFFAGGASVALSFAAYKFFSQPALSDDSLSAVPSSPRSGARLSRSPLGRPRYRKHAASGDYAKWKNSCDPWAAEMNPRSKSFPCTNRSTFPQLTDVYRLIYDLFKVLLTLNTGPRNNI